MENEAPNNVVHDAKVVVSLEIVHQALDKILASAPFHTSKQSQNLLKYLVEKALTDHDEPLKERTIGIEVFGRKPDYNTADDPIVRSRAGEVRKRLAQYYQSEVARDCVIQITLQPFSYRPAFAIIPETRNESKNLTAEIESSVVHSGDEEQYREYGASQPTPRFSKNIQRYIWAFCAVAVCSFLAFVWIGIARFQKSELELFWKPVFESKKPVLIYTGTNSVYYPVHYPDSGLFSQNPVVSEGQPSGLRDIMPPLAEGQALTAKDIEPNSNDYVQVGDIPANVNVARLLTSHHISFDLRSGSDISFEDFYKSSTVIIGAFSNPSWTLEMTRNLGFVFDRSRSIRERGGQNRKWVTVRIGQSSEQDKVVEDYAIVSRLFDAKTGGLMVSLAGLSTCGTRAASEFVTDPIQLGKLKDLPRSAWEDNNLQIVIHSSFVKCLPISTDVVAVRYW